MDPGVSQFNPDSKCRAGGPDARECEHTQCCAALVKIDVEGSDLDVLRGGFETVKSVFGIEADVVFVECNLNGPFSLEMDLWLRETGV